MGGEVRMTTDRNKRLQSFLAGDLSDAYQALTLCLASDALNPAQRARLNAARGDVTKVSQQVQVREAS